MSPSIQQIQQALPEGRLFLSGCQVFNVPVEQISSYLQETSHRMIEATSIDVQVHDISGVCEKFPYAFSVPEGTDIKAIKKILYPPPGFGKLNLHAGDDNPEFQVKMARRQAWLEKQRNGA